MRVGQGMGKSIHKLDSLNAGIILIHRLQSCRSFKSVLGSCSSLYSVHLNLVKYITES